MPFDDPDLPTQGFTPTKDELKDFNQVRIQHKKPDIGYSLLLPREWVEHPIPPGKTDLSDESSYVPIGLFSQTADMMPPFVLSIGVRPTPKAKGYVADWLERQCEEQRLVIEKMKIHHFLVGAVVEVAALQQADLAPMKLRIAMFEDGGRLFVLTAMAPASLWQAAVATLSLAIATFELDDPKGPTVALIAPPREGLH